jgi:hypothetical protein
MASNRTAGTRVLNVEIDEELRGYLDKFVKVRKETRREVVERALRAEFVDPAPQSKPTPLPPLEDPTDEKPGKKKKVK